MQVFNNVFLTITIEQENINGGNPTMELYWNDVTASMSEKEGMALLCILQEKKKQYNPASIIGNYSNPDFEFVFPLKQWLGANVIPQLTNYRRKKVKGFLIG